MAFKYIAGVTTPGAPDEVADWFAQFQAWITGTVGWRISSGAGTTNLCIWSDGETHRATMLYAHLWRDPINLDRVNLEMRDMPIGAPGAHETTRGGYIRTNNQPVEFWMAADLDAMALDMYYLPGAYRLVYGGMIRPFAAAVVDETYRIVSSLDLNNATILRRFDNLWDQDDFLYENTYMLNARRDRDDGSLSLGNLMFGDNADIAGEFKHITCQITDPVLSTPVRSAQTTGPAGAQTTWIVLQDSQGWRFAMRTGGLLPTGRRLRPSYFTWTPATTNGFFGGLVTFMEGMGFSSRNISALTGWQWDWEFNSSGVNGAEDIWIQASCAGPGAVLIFYVADSAFGTPGRHVTVNNFQPGVRDGDFPRVVYLVGDPDCLVVCIPLVVAPNRVNPGYMGAVASAARGLSSPYMRVVVMGGAGAHWQGAILEAHDGLWDQTVNAMPQGDGVHALNSNANNYDGQTYFVWPFLISETLDGEIIGETKFVGATHGGGVAQGDWIQCDRYFFLVFEEPIGHLPFAIRTTETGVGTIYIGANVRGLGQKLDRGVR